MHFFPEFEMVPIFFRLKFPISVKIISNDTNKKVVEKLKVRMKEREELFHGQFDKEKFSVQTIFQQEQFQVGGIPFLVPFQAERLSESQNSRPCCGQDVRNEFFSLLLFF